VLEEEMQADFRIGVGFLTGRGEQGSRKKEIAFGMVELFIEKRPRHEAEPVPVDGGRDFRGKFMTEQGSGRGGIGETILEELVVRSVDPAIGHAE
jgi:hypothetical protein